MAQKLVKFASDGQVDVRTVENVVLIDMDDTIVKFFEEWLLRYNTRNNKELTIEQVTRYEIHKCEGFDSSFYEVLNDLDLYDNLSPINGAIEAVEKISEYFVVLFCTHAVHGKAAESKFNWIKKHIKLHPAHYLGKLEDHIITAKQKSLINAYAIIDDSPTNAVGHKAAFNSYVLGVEFPWNTEFKSKYDLLASSWKTPEMAWKEITNFLIKSLQKGKRDNNGKSPWHLLPYLSSFEITVSGSSSSIVTKENATNYTYFQLALYSWYKNNKYKHLMELYRESLILAGFVRIKNKQKNNLASYQVQQLLHAGFAAVVDVSKFGCIKYEARNWEKGLFVESTFSSICRHYDSLCCGEDIDPESNLPHIYHIAWNAMALLETYLRARKNKNYKKFTTRYRIE